MKKLTIRLLCVIFSFVMLTGCGNSQKGAITEENLTKEAVVDTDERESKKFIDDDNKEIIIERPFEKIIVLYSAHAENLYTLGAKDKIIGAHKTCVYPPEVSLLPAFDYNGDPEAVIAEDPDCVLIRPHISDKVPDFVSAIENAGITVVSLYPSKFEDFDEYIEKLAMLTGSEDVAKTELEKFHQNLDKISSITTSILEEEKQKVFFESTETNYRTVTSDSMAGIAIDIAGGINVAKDAQPASAGSSIASFGEEKILELADEIDAYICQQGAMNSGVDEHSINIRPGFDTIKAVKEGRILLINEKIISSPTFRYYEGVSEIARFLYPEYMKILEDYETEEPANK